MADKSMRGRTPCVFFPAPTRLRAILQDAMQNPPPKHPLSMAAMAAARADAARGPEPSSWIEVNAAAVEHNTKVFHALLSGSRPAKLVAVVKKNAYGMGAAQVARAAVKAGAAMLAVYAPREAEELLEAGIHHPTLLMMPLERLSRRDNALYRHAALNHLHITVHDLDQLHTLNEVGREQGPRLQVHLHLDTGMSRGGFLAADLARIVREFLPNSFLKVAGLYSHLAASDTDAAGAARQTKAMLAFREAHKEALPADLLMHSANTCAVLRDPGYHLHAARVGLGLHGYGPEQLSGPPVIPGVPALQPIMAWKSRLIHAGRFPAGSTVGYHGTYRLPEDAPLGLVPVGYADGYPLTLANQGVVRVRRGPEAPWVPCPVRGLINMDQFVVDLTPLCPAGHDPAPLKRAEVEVIAADLSAPNSLAGMAAASGIHAYAFLCGIHPSVPRRYL